MKKPVWSVDHLQQLGEDIAQFGIHLVWNRLKLSPDDKVIVENETLPMVEAMMRGVTEAKGMTVTHARRAIEDVLAMALKTDRPTDDWAKAVFKYGAHWRCAQGWTEKQIRKLLDQAQASPAVTAERWKNFTLNDDQAIAMDKTIVYYEGVEAKAAKKGKTTTATTSPSALGSAFSWPFAKN